MLKFLMTFNLTQLSQNNLCNQTWINSTLILYGVWFFTDSMMKIDSLTPRSHLARPRRVTELKPYSAWGGQIDPLGRKILNFWVQKFSTFFSGFWDFDWRFFHFLSHRARRWLKKSFIDHISICNHNLGDFWPHRRDFRGGQIDPSPPSRMGRFRPPKPDRVNVFSWYWSHKAIGWMCT